MMNPYYKMERCPFKCSFKKEDGRCDINSCGREGVKKENIEVEDTSKKIYLSSFEPYK